jgi:hypothetical protein
VGAGVGTWVGAGAGSLVGRGLGLGAGSRDGAGFGAWLGRGDGAGFGRRHGRWPTLGAGVGADTHAVRLSLEYPLEQRLQASVLPYEMAPDEQATHADPS